MIRANMSAIRNPRRERFALEFYAGKTPLEAMALAGYVPAAANARRMANSPDVRRRVSELFEAERGFSAIEAVRARRERAALAYSNIADYFEEKLDADGRPTGKVGLKDFTKLPRELTAAIKEIKPTKLGFAITLHDKDASLRAIEARVDPVLKPQGDDDVPVAADQVASWEDAPAPGVRAN